MIHSISPVSCIRLAIVLSVFVPANVVAEDPDVFDGIGKRYTTTTLPILQSHCLKCHNEDKGSGDLDLEKMDTFAEVRREPRVWQKVLFMVENGEMPPKKSAQLSTEESQALRGWILSYLDAEAHANAGDPGRVVMRRLTNAEFDHTIRDLTGIDFRPTREFPADSAAGEGFTNTGESMVMSPALLDKYLDAAQKISRHMVLLPDGLRFSQATARRDWADEPLDEIRALYARHSEKLEFLDKAVGTRTHWGLLPVSLYCKVIVQHWNRLQSDPSQIDEVATEAGVSATYLRHLMPLLGDEPLSPLLEDLRKRLHAATSLANAVDIEKETASITRAIDQWQEQLNRFVVVGHMLNKGQVPTDPLVSTREFVLEFDPEEGQEEVTFTLLAHGGSDGSDGDHVTWRNARLVGIEPGVPTTRLRDVRPFLRHFPAYRNRVVSRTREHLIAIAAAALANQAISIDELAKQHNLNAKILSTWIDFLNIQLGPGEPVEVQHLLGKKNDSLTGLKYVKAWGDVTPNLLANSSHDKTATIPGTIPPRTVSVHPGPTRYSAAGWKSPISGRVRIDASVADAHGCGDGIAWAITYQRGTGREILTSGLINVSGRHEVPTIEDIPVYEGAVISLVVSPRDNSGCDQTNITLTIVEKAEKPRTWDLTADIVDDVLASNPHADRLGNKEVWYFYWGESSELAGYETPPPQGSVISLWRAAVNGENTKEATRLAEQVHTLLNDGPQDETSDVDRQLYEHSHSATSELFESFEPMTFANAVSKTEGEENEINYGLDPALFKGDGNTVTLNVQAPSAVQVTVPAEMARKRQLVVTGEFAANAGDGCVQLEVVSGSAKAKTELLPSLPIFVRAGGGGTERMKNAFEDFREIFPQAVCYRTVVPTDEIITLVMYHREDDHLYRLMLSDAERVQLDRLWQEVRYVSQEDIVTYESYPLFMEFASQSGELPRFEPLREPVRKKFEEFSRYFETTKPRHIDALVDFAEKAFRRHLTEPEEWQLRAVYARLRAEEESHESALRGVLVRVLISPSFLYRIEEPIPGDAAGAVSRWELATRLSYFLWSSLPDGKLIASAANSSILDPDRLVEQAHRMLRDNRVRGLATEFACQWLHVRGFDSHDEKNERQYPYFSELRDDMYEETIRFFEDLFRRDGSVLEILDADHTFVNGPLAKHYGFDGVEGESWVRVDKVKQKSRGGILGMATVLSKQSGATRTSPVLRGNWIVETLLGEKLPDPPATVPELPDALSREGLTVRQMTERHVSDESCANCHVRIDPFGFALESFDAIGRFRLKDLVDQPVDTHARLRDGTEFEGIQGLREYLLGKRRDDFLKQFCRKLLGFAIGRSVELSDQPLVDEMRRHLIEKDFRFSAAVEAILRSQQFRFHRGLEATHEESI